MEALLHWEDWRTRRDSNSLLPPTTSSVPRWASWHKAIINLFGLVMYEQRHTGSAAVIASTDLRESYPSPRRVTNCRDAGGAAEASAAYRRAHQTGGVDQNIETAPPLAHCRLRAKGRAPAW